MAQFGQEIVGKSLEFIKTKIWLTSDEETLKHGNYAKIVIKAAKAFCNPAKATQR
jgi:hypothetical protein